MGLNLTKKHERPNIMFAPSLKADVAEIRSHWDDDTYHVAKHGTVGFAVVDLSRFIGPCHIEDVGDIVLLARAWFWCLRGPRYRTGCSQRDGQRSNLGADGVRRRRPSMDR